MSNEYDHPLTSEEKAAQAKQTAEDYLAKARQILGEAQVQTKLVLTPKEARLAEIGFARKLYREEEEETFRKTKGNLAAVVRLLQRQIPVMDRKPDMNDLINDKFSEIEKSAAEAGK